jgi:tetrahydromethanopterin S-methyltransferase subunit E
MAHVLGYGTIWSARGLLVGAVASGGTDPHFIGTRAVDEFNAGGGTTYSGGLKVPVENTGGNGTTDSHWRESVFGNELMTGFVDPGVNPLSRVSIASMGDLGYSVNLTGADDFMLGASFLALGGRPSV